MCIHLVSGQQPAVPPLGVEAPIDGAVLADLLLAPRVVLAQLAEVADGPAQLLVAAETPLYLCRVTPGQGRGQPADALGHAALDGGLWLLGCLSGPAGGAA